MPSLRSTLRRVGFAHPVGRDPGRTTSTYHRLPQISPKTGHFYLAEDRTFLFGVDSALLKLLNVAPHNNLRSFSRNFVYTHDAASNITPKTTNEKIRLSVSSSLRS